MEKLTYENAELRRLNKKILRRGGFAVEEVIDDLRQVLQQEKQNPFNITLNSRSLTVDPNKHSETVALVLSDWHFSEVVSELEVNGINKYNSMIAANRVYEIISSAIKIIKLHQNICNVEKIWLVLLGDFLSGSHLDELALTNDLSDHAATILVSRILCLVVNEFKTLGIPIEIDCVCGNHGRTSLKLPIKRVAYNTYDWIAYEILYHYFENDSQVKITTHPGYIVPIAQYGHQFILIHGSDGKIKESGIDDTLRAIFDSQEYRNKSKKTGESFEMIITGHYHQSIIRDKLLVNSALTGTSELVLAWHLKPNAPSQTLFGISKKHFRTFVYVLDASGVRSEKPENIYSEYTKKYMDKHGR